MFWFAWKSIVMVTVSVTIALWFAVAKGQPTIPESDLRWSDSCGTKDIISALELLTQEIEDRGIENRIIKVEYVPDEMQRNMPGNKSCKILFVSSLFKFITGKHCFEIKMTALREENRQSRVMFTQIVDALHQLVSRMATRYPCHCDM